MAERVRGRETVIRSCIDPMHKSEHENRFELRSTRSTQHLLAMKLCNGS